MNQVITTNSQDVLANRTQLDLIKSLYCKGCSDEEFQLFTHVCHKTGLDPALRQIFPVKRWDNKMKREVMTIQTGIDGYRLIAERTKRYAPGREPTYQYDTNGHLLSATAYVKKQTADGTWHEVAATAFYCEYCQKDKEGNPTRFWQQMGHNQLAKCAEALALRKAFPGDLSGIYTKEEMDQAEVLEISDVPKQTMKLKVDTITSEQAEELNVIFSECEPSYMDKVWQTLRKPPISISSIEQLPASLFDRIKSAAMKNRLEHQFKQREIVEQFIEPENEYAIASEG